MVTDNLHSSGEPFTPEKNVPTEAFRGSAVVADLRDYNEYPVRELVGQRIEVVRLVYNTGDIGWTQYLDNRDGYAWTKVCEGQDDSQFGTRSIAIEEDSFQLMETEETSDE